MSAVYSCPVTKVFGADALQPDYLMRTVKLQGLCSGLPGSGLAGGAADARNKVAQADVGRQARVLQLFVRHR